MRSQIAYCEKPASKEEKEVAAFFEARILDFKEGNYENLRKSFLPGFIFVDSTGKSIDLDNYLKKITEEHTELLYSIKENVIIRMRSLSRATVSCTSIRQSRADFYPKIGELIYELAREANGWKVEKIYLSAPYRQNLVI